MAVRAYRNRAVFYVEYADNEVHITADVAFGVMHYYFASGDEKFLFDKGAEILLETSRFWSERVDKGEDGEYHLLNVMGPDVYKRQQYYL